MLCCVLCYSHKKKRTKQIKKYMQRGQLDLDKAGQFSLFLETSDITYCLYRDSERVLGNTFGMCILQVLLQAPVYTVAIVVMVLAVC
jgi:tRNA(Met) C34 N-acetyltransferase TmcA